METTMTLTPQDLQAIKGIVTDTVSKTVPPIVNKAVGEAIDELSLQVGAGFNEMTERFERVEADISELKADVAELKTDVAELKTDMREVKWHLADTVRRSEFTGLHQRVGHLEQGSN